LPGPALPAFPSALEYTGEVAAFVFGMTRALESLDFPLYELRSKLVDGRLYLASVPSVRAEADLERKLQRVHDSSLRYTQDIRRGWERGPKQEAESYNQEIAQFGASQESGLELAEAMRPLLRTRGNAWFVAFRSALAPAAMLAAEAQGRLPQTAADVVRDTLAVVQRDGSAAFSGACERLGIRLAQASIVNHPQDVAWIEWDEVRQALREGVALQSLVEARQAEAAARPKVLPPTIGPELGDDAPRMYLVREILALFG